MEATHAEVVAAKATRKLAIVKKLTEVKKLAGTTWGRGGGSGGGGGGWGANSDTLKQVYTGTLRPVIKCASTTRNTASKTNKPNLDRVQNMGLRCHEKHINPRN